MMDNLRGAFLMVLSMLGFAFEDMFIKLMADEVPVGQIIATLGVGGGAIFAVAVRAQGHRILDPGYLSMTILLRGLGEMVGAIAFITALALTPLSSASAILQATPLVVTLGAALFLGERVGWRRWSAVVVGLAGVLLIIRPGMADFEPLSLLALLAVFALAVRDIATRRAPPEISSMQLSFLGFVAIIPGGIGWMWVMDTAYVVPSPLGVVYVGAALCVGTAAYYAIVAAMRVGEVSFVSPFRYTRLIFAMFFGVVVFSERPDALTLLGAAIIVASGIYTVWRERKLGKTPVAKPTSAR